MEFELPFCAISYNKHYRLFRGRICVSAEAKQFRERVWAAIKDKGQIKGRVSLTVAFHYKNKFHYDLDNALKALIDALKDHCIQDDSEIFELKATKHIGIIDRMNICIRKM